MAKDHFKPPADKPAAAAVESKKPEKVPQKYTLDALRENSMKIFGISECDFIGASYGLSGEYTISEMEEKIKEWKKKEAK